MSAAAGVQEDGVEYRSVDVVLALVERNAVAARAQIQAARLPDAGRLAVGAGTAESDGPWILLVPLNLDEAGHPVIFSHDYYRGDRFTFNVFRRRFE